MVMTASFKNVSKAREIHCLTHFPADFEKSKMEIAIVNKLYGEKDVTKDMKNNETHSKSDK